MIELIAANLEQACQLASGNLEIQSKINFIQI
jgi:hypothetical protein